MDPLLTAKDVAEVLRLSISKVYELCSSGKIPHLRVGGSIRFSRDALSGFINESVVDQSEGTKTPPRRLKSRHFNL